MNNNNNIEQIDKVIGNYQIQQELLGTGSYGICKKASSTINNQQLAVKIVSKLRLKEGSNLQEALKRLNLEIDILKKLNSPNIMKIYDIIQTDNNIYMFLEYCNGGNLGKFIKQGKIPEQQVIKYLQQIREAYKELYKNNIIHRDIKPENILLHNDDIKIGDFGFARELGNMQDRVAMTYLGTPYYSAIEILVRGEYSSKCDIFSFGIIIYQLLFGMHPYLSQVQLSHPSFIEEIAKIYRDSQNKLTFPLLPQIQNPDLLDLIKRMLQIYEKDRIGWEELFNHQLFNKHGQTSLIKSHKFVKFKQNIAIFYCETIKQIFKVYKENIVSSEKLFAKLIYYLCHSSSQTLQQTDQQHQFLAQAYFSHQLYQQDLQNVQTYKEQIDLFLQNINQIDIMKQLQKEPNISNCLQEALDYFSQYLSKASQNYLIMFRLIQITKQIQQFNFEKDLEFNFSEVKKNIDQQQREILYQQIQKNM